MEQSTFMRRIPWGVLLTWLALAVIVIVVHRGQGEPRPWAGVLFTALAAICVFTMGRWLVGWVWGAVMALTLAASPAVLAQSAANSGALEGEALKLLVLAATMRAWQHLFRPTSHSGQFLPVGLLLVLTVPMSWLGSNDPGVWLVATATAAIGLMAALALAVAWRQQVAAVIRPAGVVDAPFVVPPPTSMRVALFAGVTVLVAIMGVTLVPVLAQAAQSLQQQGVDVSQVVRRQILDFASLQTTVENAFVQQPLQEAMPGLTQADLELWAWPWFWPNLLPTSWLAFWVVIVLLVLGVFRSGWRGWLQWSRRQPPVAWLLTLYVALVAGGYWLDPMHLRTSQFLPLATLAAILPLYGIADLIAGVGEGLRLPPPESGSPGEAQ